MEDGAKERGADHYYYSHKDNNKMLAILCRKKEKGSYWGEGVTFAVLQRGEVTAWQNPKVCWKRRDSNNARIFLSKVHDTWGSSEDSSCMQGVAISSLLLSSFSPGEEQQTKPEVEKRLQVFVEKVVG